MTIVDAYWTPAVNILKIQCDCGHMFYQRSDRQNVKCSNCKATQNLHAIRQSDLESQDEVKFE